jgi:hypothetical protein
VGDFSLFLRLGWDHILEGYDHLLFLLVLLAPLRSVKQVVFTVSAFTVTHTISMALVVFEVLSINAGFVEAAIAATIVYSALENLFQPSGTSKWVQAALFGFIHGAGFSNYLIGIVNANAGDLSIGSVLLGFLVGLELGQLLVAGIIGGAVWISLKFKKGELVYPEIYRLVAAFGFYLVITRIFEV